MAKVYKQIVVDAENQITIEDDWKVLKCKYDHESKHFHVLLEGTPPEEWKSLHEGLRSNRK